LYAAVSGNCWAIPARPFGPGPPELRGHTYRLYAAVSGSCWAIPARPFVPGPPELRGHVLKLIVPNRIIVTS